MAVVVVTLNRRLLEGPVHPLDLAIRPGMVRLCESMLDSMVLTGAIEWVSAPEGCQPRAVLGQVGKLNAVVGENNCRGQLSPAHRGTLEP